jgi:hypothetical protein
MVAALPGEIEHASEREIENGRESQGAGLELQQCSLKG